MGFFRPEGFSATLLQERYYSIFAPLSPLKKLESFANDLEPQRLEADEPSLSEFVDAYDLVDGEFPMTREFRLDTSQRLNAQKILEMNESFITQQKAAYGFLATLNDIPERLDDPTRNLRAVHRCGLRNLIQELNPAPIFNPGALRNERVFEEFFEICQIPNEAEVELLGIVGEVGAEAVLSWFAEKRNRTYPQWGARRAIQVSGPLEKERQLHYYAMERDLAMPPTAVAYARANAWKPRNGPSLPLYHQGLPRELVPDDSSVDDLSKELKERWTYWTPVNLGPDYIGPE